MGRTIVMPSVRIPKKLWVYLEKLMEKKMFTSKAELIKEALREYVEKHKGEIDVNELNVSEAMLILEMGRIEDRTREEELIELSEKLCLGHKLPNNT